MNASCPNCRDMRDKLEEVQEELRQVQRMAMGDEFTPPFSWALTRSEAIIMRLLCARVQVSRENMAAAIEAERHDWDADFKIFNVFICKIRNKLAPFGGEIVSVWSRGYRIRDDLREATLAACRGGNPYIGPPIPRQASGFKLTMNQSVLGFIETHPNCTVPMISQTTLINETQVRGAIERLLDQGKIVRDRPVLPGRCGQPAMRFRLATSKVSAAA